MSDSEDSFSATEKDIGEETSTTIAETSSSSNLEESTSTNLEEVVPVVSSDSSESVVAENMVVGDSDEADAGLGVDDDGEADDDDDDDDDGDNEPGVGEETKTIETKPHIKRKKGPLEYDIEDMYPEIGLLVKKKRSQWNYQDPNYIRAIWLETKTNILADWKMKYTKIDYTKAPTIEVKDNLAQSLRREKLGEIEKSREWWLMYVPPGQDPPLYKTVHLPTNMTMEVRYNYVRNNPPVPSSYVTHFEKYRKPPFIAYKPPRCFPQIGA